MSERKDDQPAPPNPAPSGSAAAGRVETDSRGRNVWRWADAGGSTSILLKRLENQDLALEPTRKVPIMPAKHDPAATKPAVAGGKSGSAGKPAAAMKSAAAAKGKPVPPSELKKRGGGGFDPYNSR